MPRTKLPEKSKKVRVNVSIDPKNDKHIKSRAKRAGTPVSAVVNDLITADRTKP